MKALPEAPRETPEAFAALAVALPSHWQEAALSLSHQAEQLRVDLERTLGKEAKGRPLRSNVELAVMRLIAFLDASDPYVMTELEDDDDREPVGDEEPSLGSLDRAMDQTKWPRGNQWEVDCELDTSDDEPSLGSLERPCCSTGWPDGPNPTGDQTYWSAGDRCDREPSLSGGGWSQITDDREQDNSHEPSGDAS